MSQTRARAIGPGFAVLVAAVVTAAWRLMP